MLVLGPTDLEAIQAAIERARARPIPWEVLKRSAIGGASPYYRLEDRQKSSYRPQSEMVMLPFGYRLAVSFEYQPAGLCLHISVSTPNPADTVVNEHAMALLAKTCAMQWPPGSRSRVWMEDFIAGPMIGKAINLIEVVESAA